MHCCALGDLQLQGLCRQSRVLKRRFYQPNQILALQLPHRYIHGNLQVLKPYLTPDL